MGEGRTGLTQADLVLIRNLDHLRGGVVPMDAPVIRQNFGGPSLNFVALPHIAAAGCSGWPGSA